MERTIQVLNALEHDGLYTRYAIGGAMGALFFMEPLLTFDLDVFVQFPLTAGGLITLVPIYDALKKRGYSEKEEHVDIEGTYVQFLPVHNPLTEEALKEALDTQFGETPTRVFHPEHLMAIMLQTGREKDLQRFAVFNQQVKVDAAYLNDVLTRHVLLERWAQWNR
ncbi:MAG TPA: hypothetical protein PLI09_21275 [Candidatus Hydrogenedentes bacterium]|nr:hypothetical protein [Candidatus Hydrogenedentota bacterium]